MKSATMLKLWLSLIVFGSILGISIDEAYSDTYMDVYVNSYDLRDSMSDLVDNSNGGIVIGYKHKDINVYIEYEDRIHSDKYKLYTLGLKYKINNSTRLIVERAYDDVHQVSANVVVLKYRVFGK